LGPTQPPIEWVPEFFPEAHHSPPSGVESKNE